MKIGTSLLEDTNSKLLGDLESLQCRFTEQVNSMKNKLSNEHTLVKDYEECVARLLAKRAIVCAQSRLSAKSTNDVSHEKIQQLCEELQKLHESHTSTCSDLDCRKEELRNQKLEMNKIKMHLTTEIELQKALITQLEKEKNELKVNTSFCTCIWT